jgi:type II secretory ATPase GspE/PulE/Tfp pilus assembly ATPase PilB-like protein
VQSPANNIITVEDPIEYRLAGINQVQINTKAGVPFAAGLRSILRQDPNIIMVGEIRDRETAAIAVEASQTGHLLFSTLHTNNAPATIARLVDLGIELYMVASSVVGILAQRLVRRPCPGCSEPKMPSPELLDRIGAVDRPHGSDNWVEGRGCRQCKDSGFKGRVAIHELMAINDELRDLITSRAPEHRIREAARRNGMRRSWRMA